MSRPLPAALAAVLATASVQAEPVTPEEFRDYAEGWTLHFERDGEPWGDEFFGPDGTVRWRYPTGQCVSGVWKAHEGQVCFYYGPGTEVLCWDMRREDGELAATLNTGPDAGMQLRITGRDRQPVLCGGEGAQT